MKPLRSLYSLLVLLTVCAMTSPAIGQSSATIVKRLMALETKVATLTDQVSALETDNAAKTAQLNSQALRIADLETQVAALTTTQGAHTTAIAGLQDNLSNEAAARQAGDQASVQTAHQYTDAVGASTLAAANTYADSKSSSMLSQAETYSDAALNPIKDKLIHFSRNGNDVYITGANVHILSGTGTTYGSINGLGNLIIGYNEIRSNGGVDVRTGSHNLVLGFANNYSAAGAILDGAYNTSSGHFASVLGGTGNTASGYYSVVSGGYNNQALGNWSTIGGGANAIAATELAHVP